MVERVHTPVAMYADFLTGKGLIGGTLAGGAGAGSEQVLGRPRGTLFTSGRRGGGIDYTINYQIVALSVYAKSLTKQSLLTH